jgi:hypothetical protein
MLKKYIICFLILSFLNFTGCTSLEVISKDDVDAGRAEINFGDELYLTTKNFTRYHFLAYTYQIANDTIYGNGAIEDSSSITPFKGSIALNEVINFEQNKPDTGATIGLFGGIIVVGLLVFGIMFAAALGDTLNPD